MGAVAPWKRFFFWGLSEDGKFLLKHLEGFMFIDNLFYTIYVHILVYIIYYKLYCTFEGSFRTAQ